MAELADLLGLAWDDRLTAAVDHADDALQSGRPAPIRPNLACLDYSAVKYGKLVAYRLDDETRLDPDKFCWVEVERPEAPR